MNPVDPLHTSREVAALLCVSLRTLEDWRYEGKGPPYVKYPRGVRYSRAALDEWIKENTVKPVA